MPEHKKLSRRDFIKVSLTSLWSLILAACFPTIDEDPPATESPGTERPITEVPETKEPAEPIPTEPPTQTPMECFKLIEPPDKAELGNRGRVTFMWEAQDGASSYKLIITLPNELVEEYETEITQFEKYLESLPLKGEYQWQVAAFDDELVQICISEILVFFKKATSNSGGGDDGKTGGRNGGNSGGGDGGNTGGSTTGETTGNVEE